MFYRRKRASRAATAQGDSGRENEVVDELGPGN